MLSLFNKGDSANEAAGSGFSVLSLISSGGTPGKKAYDPSKDSKDRSYNPLSSGRDSRDFKPSSASKPVNSSRPSDSYSKDRPISKDNSRPSQPMRSESNSRPNDRPRPISSEKRDGEEFTIKRKVNYNTEDSSPKIKKLDSSSRPQVSSSINSSRPADKSSSMQKSNNPPSSGNRTGQAAAEARGKSFGGIGKLDNLPKYVSLGAPSKPDSSSAQKSGSMSSKPSGSLSSKPSGSMSSKPSGSLSSRPSGSQSSGQGVRLVNGKPVPTNPSQSKPSSMAKPISRPSSGNSMAKPMNKTSSSNTGSRPGSQPPVKRPIGNGPMSKSSSNGAPSKPSNVTKSKPVKVTPPPAPLGRWLNGKFIAYTPEEAAKKGLLPKDGSNLGKRPGDHLPNSKYEPGTNKKPMPSSLSQVFKGPPKKMGRGRYDDDDDYDDDDSFIDNDDQDDEAKQELSKIFGGYRKRVQNTRHLVDDVSDMEAGFDVIERENEISKLIGDEEDRRQYEYIKKEAEQEARQAMKRKKLQLD